MKAFFLAFWSTLFLISPVLAYQSPGAATGFVNDFAGILSIDNKNQLETQLKDYSTVESNEIVIVTIKSLEGETIESYAEKLFKEWGIGTAKNDNGVLLLVAPSEREVRIEVGYGLEGALTDVESKMIIERIMVPAFQAGDYNGGVDQAVLAMMDATKGEYTPPANTSSSKNRIGGTAIWIIFFLVVEGISFGLRRMAKSKSIWPGALTGAILGGIIGIIIAAQMWIIGLILGGGLFGLLLDYILSHTKVGDGMRRGGPGGGFFIGGFGGGGGGGGFGGFGGGSSGGGGASGRW